MSGEEEDLTLEDELAILTVLAALPKVTAMINAQIVYEE